MYQWVHYDTCPAALPKFHTVHYTTRMECGNLLACSTLIFPITTKYGHAVLWRLSRSCISNPNNACAGQSIDIPDLHLYVLNVSHAWFYTYRCFLTVLLCEYHSVALAPSPVGQVLSITSTCPTNLCVQWRDQCLRNCPVLGDQLNHILSHITTAWVATSYVKAFLLSDKLL